MTTGTSEGPSRAWRVHLAWAGVAGLAVAATWIAAAVVLSPAVPPSTDPAPQTYTVSQGEVGSSIGVQATVSFADARTVTAARAGTITTVPLATDDPIEEGTVLATIDMRPVVVAAGEVPAYRDLSLGNRGPDVAQLRAFLGEPPGDVFDDATRLAVIAWQERVGFVADGIVRLGDVVFVSDLPARGSLAGDIQIGAQVTPGAPLFTVAESRPQVRITADSNNRIATGMTARVSLPDGGEISGAVAGPFDGPDGLQVFHVVDAEGRSACDDACAAQFAAAASSQVAASVETAPTVEGLVVPDSALITRPDGATAVRNADGELVEVTIEAHGEGVAVVSGIDEGVVILLFDQIESS